MSYLFTALSELTTLVAPIIAKVTAGTITSPGPWRPPEWHGGKALTSLTVPASDKQGPQVFVFDAVFRVDHVRELRRTEHPIQTSSASQVATISDHAYRMPARVTLDIGMSDAMASYKPGMWASGKNLSKSVSAYQTLVDLQNKRQLLTLTTRLDTYSNMIIELITPVDTVQTLHGLRCQVVFSQIFLAEITSAGSKLIFNSDDSDRPQTTGASPSGVVQALPASSDLVSQYQVASDTQTSLGARIPGAGSWSSVSPNRFGGLFA
jgi:hypothetical protein